MSMKSMKTALCAALMLSGGIALADAPPARAADTHQEKGDQQFLGKALGINQLELQLGQLAVDRATTSEVKAMGQKMVASHSELGHRLAALDRQAGGSAKAELSSDQRATYDRVASQSGSGFDSVFKEVVNAGHIQELAMYQGEVSRATTPALRELAQQRVVKLKETIAQAGAQKPAPEPTAGW